MSWGCFQGHLTSSLGLLPQCKLTAAEWYIPRHKGWFCSIVKIKQNEEIWAGSTLWYGTEKGFLATILARNSKPLDLLGNLQGIFPELCKWNAHTQRHRQTHTHTDKHTHNWVAWFQTFKYLGLWYMALYLFSCPDPTDVRGRPS
jgi:hypothetical protein